MIHRRTLLAAALAAPAIARAADYPDRPITLVVPFLAGGSADLAARVLADRMAPHLGPAARMVIENRSGAGGTVGAEYVRNARPDGATLLLGTASTHGTSPAALPATTRYDPLADFAPVAIVGGGPMVLLVPAASPHRTPADLVAALRAQPDRLAWATSGTGGIGHLTGELFRQRAGGPAGPLRAEHIPYRGGSAVMEALAKGEVAYAVEVLASTTGSLRDGLDRALAVTGPHRSPLFPAVPTLAETVLPGFDVTTWEVLLGPRALPPAIVTALNRAANAALSEPAVQSRLNTAGVEPAGDSTPESTRAFLAAELAKFRAIVSAAGLHLEG